VHSHERTDEALALGVQQGSMEDLSMLIERHYSPLLGFLYRMGLMTLAEDMAQETFLRVLKGISFYQPSRPFKPWLYSIALNLVRNYQKRADTQRGSETLDEEVQEVSSLDAQVIETPEINLLNSEAAQTVLDALAQLPDHQRSVVVLFYYQELSQKEIAETLRIPVGTVKSRLSLGLRRLRELIEIEEQQGGN
jgi:RNA polymerase sigma-70 factor, ECF subfamily